jgi:RNA polymerase sigma-70 factor (ECF subfamily)
MPLVAGLEDEGPSARAARLFDAHQARLYRLARRLTASPEEARDLVQDTFLKVVRAPGLVPTGVQSEEAWLVRVLVNACRDEWRRGTTRRRYQSEFRRDADTDSTSGERALIARDTIWHALQRLPPRRRAIVVLYELDEVGIAEIARMLGVSAITVRWHLARGRKELAGIINATEGGMT